MLFGKPVTFLFPSFFFFFANLGTCKLLNPLNTFQTLLQTQKLLKGSQNFSGTLEPRNFFSNLALHCQNVNVFPGTKNYFPQS